jgi:hypothetical protein
MIDVLLFYYIILSILILGSFGVNTNIKTLTFRKLGGFPGSSAVNPTMDALNNQTCIRPTYLQNRLMNNNHTLDVMNLVLVIISLDSSIFKLYKSTGLHFVVASIDQFSSPLHLLNFRS